MDIVEVFDKRERRTWLIKFAKSYDGLANQINRAMYSDAARFFFAVENRQKIGFLRCVDKSMYFDLPPKTVFSASDAYVTPEYRNRGVLRQLLEHALRFSNVQMLHIEISKYVMLREYYRRLGFTKTNSVESSLIWVFQEPFFNTHFAVNDNEANALDDEMIPDITRLLKSF